LRNAGIDHRFDILFQIYGIDQGWPDFFSQGPFSEVLNVLGAASSFQTRDRYPDI
jgi:hypothetical protein